MVVFARRSTNSYTHTRYFYSLHRNFGRRERKGSDKPIPIRINAPSFTMQYQTAGTKAPMLFPERPVQNARTPFDRAFPNSHVLDHAMHRSLKEQFKPRQLCHFPSLSSPVCMFRWENANKLSRSAYDQRSDPGYDISPSSSSSSSSSSSRLSIASLMNCAA